MRGGLRTEADTTAPPPFLLQLALASARACDTAESRQRVPISGVSLGILSTEPVGTAVDGAQRGRGWLWMPVGARTGCPNGEARNGVHAPALDRWRSDARASTDGSTAAAAGCANRGETRVEKVDGTWRSTQGPSTGASAQVDRAWENQSVYGTRLHHREERRRYTRRHI